MDAAAAGRGDLERVRRRDARDSSLPPGCRRDRAATARSLAAEALARGRRRFHPRAAPDRASNHACRASGLVDDRCHHSNAVPSVREASEAARMGHRRTVEGPRPTRPPWNVLVDAGWRRACCWRRRRRRAYEARIVADCRAVPDLVDAVAGRRAMGEPAGERRRQHAALRRVHPRTTTHRPSDVAFLRDVRHDGAPWTAAGQLPGNSDAGRRPSDIAHEHGTLPAVGRRRPRFRMAGHARDRGSAGGDARDHERARAFPRPFL